MGADALISYQTLFGFLFALARVSAVMAFLPLAAFRAGPDAARIGLAVTFTLVVRPEWNAPAGIEHSLERIVAGVAAEAGIGLAIGVSLAFAIEAFMFAAQQASLVAGFAYASTVDPASGADSTVMITVAQLFSGLLFFVSGAHRVLVRMLAESFQRIPAARDLLSIGPARAIAQMAGTVFPVGLRLAGPVIGLILLADISLAVLGRIQSQLHLMSVAMPVKLGAAILLTALTVAVQIHVFNLRIADWVVLTHQLFRESR